MSDESDQKVSADTSPKDLAFYQSECERLTAENEQLKAENLQLRTQLKMDTDADEKEAAAVDVSADKKPKKEIKIPFAKIEDEAYLIQEGSMAASMCVTACDGELNPPFISAKGIQWLKKNFKANELDIVVDTYAKCGTTVGIKMVYKILEVLCHSHL